MNRHVVPAAIVELLRQHKTPEDAAFFQSTASAYLLTPEARSRECRVEALLSNIPDAGFGLFVRDGYCFKQGEDFPMMPMRTSNDAALLPFPRFQLLNNSDSLSRGIKSTLWLVETLPAHLVP